LYSFVRTILGAEEGAGQVPGIESEIANGQRPWRRTIVPVSGVPVEFEVFDYGSDYWAAAGESRVAYVTISRLGGPISDAACTLRGSRRTARLRSAPRYT
jgi:hypothetical protein